MANVFVRTRSWKNKILHRKEIKRILVGPVDSSTSDIRFYALYFNHQIDTCLANVASSTTYNYRNLRTWLGIFKFLIIKFKYKNYFLLAEMFDDRIEYV